MPDSKQLEGKTTHMTTETEVKVNRGTIYKLQLVAMWATVALLATALGTLGFLLFGVSK